MFPSGVMNILTAVITAKGHHRMKQFTIDQENDIRVHASAQEADAVANAERFSTSAGLAKLAEKWPAARLVEIWNSLPGVSPVKKFTDRKTAATRIWKAIQGLGETPAAKSEAVEVPAPELTPQVIEAAIPASFQPDHPMVGAEPQTEVAVEPPATEQPVSPARAKKTVATVGAQVANVALTTPAATKKATRAKKAPVAAKNAGVPRKGSKTSRVIAMLKRKSGATLQEIMTEMGWQEHTTRALMSAGGSLAKKHGLVITSEKVGDQRTYSIKA